MCIHMYIIYAYKRPEPTTVSLAVSAISPKKMVTVRNLKGPKHLNTLDSRVSELRTISLVLGRYLEIEHLDS